ncbi:MAG: 2-oxoacid:acceptor oxidoreductase family protein [Candidatus Heimdallarchaeota archaeon]
MGGQGIGSTTRVLAAAAQLADISVMTMETHGLAQRGKLTVLLKEVELLFLI